MSMAVANEQHFQSVYLDPGKKDWKDRIVFHDPIYEADSPGVAALKSLRLENTYGFVGGAPSVTIRKFREHIETLDKEKKLGKKEPAEILQFLLGEAKKFHFDIRYIQHGHKGSKVDQPKQAKALTDLDIAARARALALRKILATVPDFSSSVPSWSPALVHEKLQEVVPLLNQRCSPAMQLFFHPTQEKEDDVPILRVLSGPQDPYTAERVGSLAFFSTQRGMEWYSRLFGPADFKPGTGMVYLTYVDDRTLTEEPVLLFNLSDTAQSWADRILDLFKVPLICGCPMTCACGCRSPGSPCSCRSVTASFGQRRMGRLPPDPKLRQVILSQNCLWVSHQTPKAVANTPLYQTKKFTVYPGPASVQPGSTQATAALAPKRVTRFGDEAFQKLIRTTKAELRKIGSVRRWTLAEVADQDGLTLTLEARLNIIGDKLVEAGFEPLEATTFVKELPEATLLLQRDEKGYKARMIYETPYTATEAAVGSLTRYYNRALKGLSGAFF